MKSAVEGFNAKILADIQDDTDWNADCKLDIASVYELVLKQASICVSSAVLEVGRYETVCHTGTSAGGSKAYRYFERRKTHTGSG